MIVKWNGDGAFCVQPIDPEQPATKALLIKSIILYPGYNDVPDEQWNLCKLHLAMYFEMGKIEELSRKEKDEDGDEIFVGIPFENFATRKESIAIDMVKNCFNPNSLKKWADETNRQNVLKEIKDQLESVQTGKDIRKGR